MIRLTLIVFLIAIWTRAEDAPKPLVSPAPFAVVMIDEASEKELGPFPYDRAVYAKGIEALAQAKVRGVVLKFFIDRPKTAEGDAALPIALTKVKVILQARMDDDEAKANPLPERFILNGLGASDATPFSGKSGWLPLPALSKNAYDLGFIDSMPWVELIPVIERYQGHDVKSLYTAALELATKEQAKISPGKFLQLGGKKIGMDDRCYAKVTLPAADTLAAYSFIDLIHVKIPAEKLADRVVILGYDGAKMETNKTAIGSVKGHRLFCYQLFSLYREVGRE